VAVIEDVGIRRAPLVTLAGEVDSCGSGHVEEVLAELLESGCGSPRVDLAEVSFMDTAGLLAILRWCEQFREKERDFEVVSINPLVRRLFEIAGYSDIIHRSEERSLPPPPQRQPITDCLAIAEDWEIRSFSVAARLESCKIVRDRIAQMAARMPFSKAEQADIKLAVGEAAANAIRHGSAERPQQAVAVRCLATRRKLVVEISDAGPGFDPHAVPSASADDGIWEGSMGIDCMRQCMDEVTFRFDEGTTVRLVKFVGACQETANS